MTPSFANEEVPWWIWAMLLVFWIYFASYVSNRLKGRSAQWLGPVRIDLNSPPYLKRLVDVVAMCSFLGSLYVAGVLMTRG